jgi:hypothetical protein
MKTIAWNSTNEEFSIFYDTAHNYDNLINYYMINSSQIQNKFRKSKDPYKYRTVFKTQMRQIYINNEHYKPRFMKFKEWLIEDKKCRLRKRELQNNKEQNLISDMKDKENDKLRKELQDAKLIIINLQKELSLVKKQTTTCKIVQNAVPSEAMGRPTPMAPTSLKKLSPTDLFKKDIFELEEELFAEYLKGDMDKLSRNEVMDTYSDFIQEESIERDLEDFAIDITDNLENKFRNRLKLD